MASQTSTSPTFSSNDPSANQVQYTLNSKIMVAAIVILFLVVFFVISLHVYAKWFWRHTSLLSNRRTPSWRRRHRLDFTGEEPFIANRSIGLDKAVIDSLPTFNYQAPTDEEEAILECAVCLCEFQENEKGSLLPRCKHSFHTDCIDMWFHSHSTCPLCRTAVMPEMPSNTHQHLEQDTSAQGSSSPLPLLQNMDGSQHHPHHQGHVTPDGMAPRADDSMLLPSISYPSNILFWGSHSHVSSQMSSPGIGEGCSSSTTSLPQISVEIPRQPESAMMSRCFSLSLSRCPSATDDQACSSQPLKSSSFRITMKRLLSIERSKGRNRVFPSDQESGELGQDIAIMPV